ncbi:MAG: hypothetical protein QOF83_1244 [Solirubrobacteraceae bacterium]|nr:hypothetical protein [Solirubrobacteraceae bacterium]
MIAPIALIIAAASVIVAWRRRHDRRPLPAHAVLVSPRQSTSIAHDGAVRSAQSAELTLEPDDLEKIWTPANLENLARTYWRFLSRVTLGLIKVAYGDGTRSVLLLGRPFTLLRFDAPEYTIEAEHGEVRWRIKDGLLVARNGRGCGYLSVDVRRKGIDENGRAKLKIEVEVANFYPSIAVGFSTPVYEMTQSALHVLVTNNFLRSLAKLDLAQSKIGALREDWPDGSAVANAQGAHLGPVVTGEDPAHRP